MSHLSDSELGLHASEFGERDRDIFNIIIQNSDSFLMPSEEVHEDLQKFIMPNCGPTEVYQFRKVTSLDRVQQRFLSRMNNVLINDNEAFVDNLVNTLLTDGGFDDGRNFYCGPGVLALHKGQQRYSAKADRECRVYTEEGTHEIAYVIVENKRGTVVGNSYIQLAACMIAAMQYNRNAGAEEDIIGILVLRSKFHFYRCVYNEEYLKALEQSEQGAIPIIVEQLTKSIPRKRARKGSESNHQQIVLDIIIPTEREILLKYLTTLRKRLDELADTYG